MANEMDFLSNFLGQVLSNPNTREKIGEVVDMLAGNDTSISEAIGGQEEAASANDEHYEDHPEEYYIQKSEETQAAQQLSSRLEENSGFSPDAFIKTATNALSSMKVEEDPRMNLLFALKPYLRKGRVEKVDMVVKIMQLGKMANLVGVDGISKLMGSLKDLKL